MIAAVGLAVPAVHPAGDQFGAREGREGALTPWYARALDEEPRPSPV